MNSWRRARDWFVEHLTHTAQRSCDKEIEAALPGGLNLFVVLQSRPHDDRCGSQRSVHQDLCGHSGMSRPRRITEYKRSCARTVEQHAELHGESFRIRNTHLGRELHEQTPALLL